MTVRSRTRRAPSLVFWAAVFLVCGALAAGAVLWRLHNLQGRLAHITATRTVLDQGEGLAAFLAGLQGMTQTNMTPAQWRAFNVLVEGLHAAQNDLQYVSVVRDGEILFHRQTGGLEEPPRPPPPPPGPHLESAPVSISSMRLQFGKRNVPVMVFRREVPQPDGGTVTVELGLQRSVVGETEQNAARAIRALFRLSVLTVATAFGLCLLLVTWAVRRDRRRETHARQEEHLAFSGALANGIVHDFRNPMSSVRLDAQMLERELARGAAARRERVTELSGRIGRTIARMDRVFQEFLYLARPSDEALEPVDLALCVGECLETLAPRLEQAGVRAERRLPSPAPLALAAPCALRRALVNVLLNAIQFSPRGAVIEIEARAAGGRVTIEVLDRGPGIPAAERRRVFDMFVTTRPEGTGLGLFLARTALRKCGGEIEALGREGGGTALRLALKTAAGPVPAERAEHHEDNHPDR